MALKTDDEDIRDVRMWMDYGGNGDYYINLYEVDRKILNNSGKLEKHSIIINTRIAMSGGNAPTNVKLAVANLFKAMRESGLNEHPKNDKH